MEIKDYIKAGVKDKDSVKDIEGTIEWLKDIKKIEPFYGYSVKAYNDPKESQAKYFVVTREFLELFLSSYEDILDYLESNLPLHLLKTDHYQSKQDQAIKIIQLLKDKDKVLS